MNVDRGTTAELADWVVGARAGDVPADVLDTARLLLLDGLGCGLFGSTQPWSQLVTDFVVAGGGRSEATVWGTPHRVPAASAPLANGTAVHAFEYDDLHPRAVLHAGSQAIPAAFAVAELVADQQGSDQREPVGGRELLHAVVTGFEVGARIGLATGAAQLHRGFHPSPNTGTFVAAATAARLLRLDEAQTRDAFGIAGSFGGYLMAAQYGGMVKRLHPGHSAQSGVTAALLAARGLTGTRAVLEAPYGGWAAAVAGVQPDALGQITADLGTTWELPSFSVKYYPCCGSNHTSIDAWWEILGQDRSLGPDDIDQIDVRCSTLTADHVGWPYRPDGVTAAQMNLGYCLAAAIVDGAVTIDQFAEERLAAPELLDVVRRIRVRPDDEIDALGRARRHLIHLDVTTRDGRTLTATAEHPKGSEQYPLTPTEVVEKFDLLAGRVLPVDGVHTVRQQVLALGSDDSPAVDALVRGLAADSVPTTA
ncbi:MAG: MmgE/PrpD family protein [Nocardioidaceae bacterium]